MADGTISMAEGLGIKALDSNELRRKQVPHMESPKSGIPFALNPLGASFSGLGAHSPKSSKNTSPSRKLQQVFFEEGLRVQAEAATKSSVPPSSSNGSEEQNPSSPKLAISTTTIGFGARSPKSAKTQGLSQKPDNQPSSVLNQGSPKEGTHSDSEARMLEIVGNLEDELNTSEDPFILDVLTAKLLSIQQEWNKFGKQAEEQIPPLRNQSSKAMQKNQQAIFEDGLMKEAEAKARVIHLHRNTYQFQRTPSEVRKLNPNSQQLPSTSVIKTAEMPKVSSVNAPQSRPLNNGNQSTLRNSSISGQHPEFKPKQKNDQAKPKNWASLLQSQSPSLNMKLEFFPDLLRGKEAQVEIDIELTDVGMWTKYLVGHFLDGNMPYPLVASTATYQWKELFVAYVYNCVYRGASLSSLERESFLPAKPGSSSHAWPCPAQPRRPSYGRSSSTRAREPLARQGLSSTAPSTSQIWNQASSSRRPSNRPVHSWPSMAIQLTAAQPRRAPAALLGSAPGRSESLWLLLANHSPGATVVVTCPPWRPSSAAIILHRSSSPHRRGCRGTAMAAAFMGRDAMGPVLCTSPRRRR
ncbi:hypothetical protein RHGRI_034073 [Rhododendron griersonianum]|uniref:Uncharacterized protein n=1 Tax=Rhododendron griersonianum TaxID=479676 RepID=A0AAV6HZ70_9ERIC|nr:hypothetical protein RHGRI_034073 [Rhododendron griersonianum]